MGAQPLERLDDPRMQLDSLAARALKLSEVEMLAQLKIVQTFAARDGYSFTPYLLMITPIP